ncbi:hypothetical protein ECANGB1_2624 [Enterospora canceri]|uniref:Secreted protein n=1 Tax=Enterospora canceri TaxID=1081671 RepID=A0A1Y1S9K1_9MICR|nr:hypothetical protein ECANGB1_2624 [Enterospora canceri]
MKTLTLLCFRLLFHFGYFVRNIVQWNLNLLFCRILIQINDINIAELVGNCSNIQIIHEVAYYYNTPLVNLFNFTKESIKFNNLTSSNTSPLNH